MNVKFQKYVTIESADGHRVPNSYSALSFRSIHDFEFTKELVVFDLLNISLVHGWLVDPQAAAFPVVSKLSYNQIVECIVNHQYVQHLRRYSVSNHRTCSPCAELRLTD